MKQITRRFLAVALATVLFFVSTGASEVSAAVSPRLSTTRKTITVGQSCTVKLLNNKKAVKWSVSNKNIKIVSKNNKQATIKAVKKGTSYLQAKVGKKTYKCKISVNQKKTVKPAAKTFKGIQYTVHKAPYTDSILVMVKNTNNYPVLVEGEINFYKGNDVVCNKYDYNRCLAKGATGVLRYDTDKEYDSYKVSFPTVKKVNVKSYANKIKITDVEIEYYPTFNSIIVDAHIKNDSGMQLGALQVGCVFYDSSGNILGYNSYYPLSAMEKGGSDDATFFMTYDVNGVLVKPARVEVSVQEAFIFPSE